MFGCTNRNIDYLYRDEVEGWVKEGSVKLVTAFSHEDPVLALFSCLHFSSFPSPTIHANPPLPRRRCRRRRRPGCPPVSPPPELIAVEQSRVRPTPHGGLRRADLGLHQPRRLLLCLRVRLFLSLPLKSK